MTDSTSFRDRKILRWAASNNSLIAKGLRFGVIGLLSGIVFSTVTTLLAGYFGLEPKLSSVGGYLASMPLNFVGNRRFSFRSSGSLLGDLARFCTLHLANIAITAGAMGAAVDVLDLHYLFGVVGAIVLVPVANFIFMNYWVFRKQSDPERIRSKYFSKHPNRSRF